MDIKSRIYALARRIPRGRVTTYGILAKKARTSARAVGQLMKTHKTNIPCHRVVMSDGSIGGYRGKHYGEKIIKLRKEGVKIKGKRIINFDKIILL
jgi:O-6-methylguanine DNA methyltransferase